MLVYLCYLYNCGVFIIADVISSSIQKIVKPKILREKLREGPNTQIQLVNRVSVGYVYTECCSEHKWVRETNGEGSHPSELVEG